MQWVTGLNWLPPKIKTTYGLGGSDLTLLVNYALIKRLSSTSSIYVLQLSIKAGLLGGTIPFCPQFWPNSTTSFPKVPPLGLRSMLHALTFLAGPCRTHNPPNVLTTSQRPDLVIVDETRPPQKNHRFLVMELTIPFEMNINDAHDRKSGKKWLSQLLSLPILDLPFSTGYKVELSCVEIGSRGLITNDNKTRIKTIFN